MKRERTVLARKTNTAQASPSQSPAPEANTNTQMPSTKKHTLLWRRTTSWMTNFGTLLGIVTAFFSFFPHLTISEPVSMDPKNLFSYKMNVVNEGILPVFGVEFAISPLNINDRLLANSMVTLASTKDCCIPMLSPGDGYTVTTESVLTVDMATATTADFLLVLRYRPLLPPIQMKKCSHFHMHRDSANGVHWFRTPSSC